MTICLTVNSSEYIHMARHQSQVQREIRRIEGQLLVAKQICRENVR
jgi:hypothetical protein